MDAVHADDAVIEGLVEPFIELVGEAVFGKAPPHGDFRIEGIRKRFSGHKIIVPLPDMFGIG